MCVVLRNAVAKWCFWWLLQLVLDVDEILVRLSFDLLQGHVNHPARGCMKACLKSTAVAMFLESQGKCGSWTLLLRCRLRLRAGKDCSDLM